MPVETSSGSEERGDDGLPDHSDRALFAVLAVSCVLKLVLAVAVADIPVPGDQAQYLAAGRSVAAGEGIRYTNGEWSPITQAPLYPLFIGGAFALGLDRTSIRVVQVLLSTASVFFVYLLGVRAFDRRVGLLAAGAFAFYPTAVAFTHYFWAETLFLFWWCLAVLLQLDRRGAIAAPGALFASGVCLGAAALTRSFVLYVVPLLCLYYLLVTRERRRALLQGAALVGGFALALAPNMVHIQRTYGGVVPVNASGIIWHRVYNVWEPFNTDWGIYPTRAPVMARADGVVIDGVPARALIDDPNPVSHDRAERAAALGFALEHPQIVLRHTMMRVVEFVNPTSFLIRHLRFGVYERSESGEHRGPLPGALVESVVLLTVLAYVGCVLSMGVGLVAMPPVPFRGIMILLLAATFAVHSVGQAMSRYRMALIPLFCLGAAWAWRNPEAVSRALRRPGRAGVLAVLALALVLAWGVHVGKIWMKLPSVG